MYEKRLNLLYNLLHYYMGIITGPGPVKLFVGMLSNDVTLFDRMKERLQDIYGPVDLESPVWPWEYTHYYAEEMGEGLKRKFLFFERLMSPDTISDIKVTTNKLEQDFVNAGGGRRINLDPGYLDAAKLVLVSTKDYSHRIYLGKGIYGEVTLIYKEGAFQTLPYTYPDYGSNEYRELFSRARTLYQTQVYQH